jgi:hypothetical protein
MAKVSAQFEKQSQGSKALNQSIRTRHRFFSEQWLPRLSDSDLSIKIVLRQCERETAYPSEKGSAHQPNSVPVPTTFITRE